MTRWRNLPQKREQEEVTAKDLTNTDISKMFEQELKTTIIKILAGFEKNIEDTRESFIVEIKELNTSQAEIKNAYNQDENPTGCHDTEDG